MYKEHPAFKKPEDEDGKIWRYMDFTKFVSLLDKSALFFPRADKLGDAFEGSHGKAYVSKMESTLKGGKDGERALDMLSSVYKKIVKFSFVSCWHLNEHESAAMWRLYLKSNDGIAIESTVGSLMNSIKTRKYEIYIGKVKYIDYAKEVMSGGLEEGERYPLFHKKKSFEHEQELRLIIQDFEPAKGNYILYAKPPRRKGICVPVDLDVLIREIYLAPTSPKWILKLVKSVVKKYELKKEVIQSSLDDAPVY